jgi:hypothetical protein
MYIRQKKCLHIFESAVSKPNASLTILTNMLECPKYGVPSVVWDKEELMAEFNDLS